jgi:hypothetical protein
MTRVESQRHRKKAYLTHVPKNTRRWKYQQDRKCTHKVTLRRVRATIVAVKKPLVLRSLGVCFCRFMYLARDEQDTLS